MGSGYFPLSWQDEDGAKLQMAADAVLEVAASYEDAIGTDGQFDNAARDGASIALLRLAAELIQQRIRGRKGVYEVEP